MSSRARLVPLALAIGFALLGFAFVRWLAPGYLSGRGFPLDDAWIHAVYARSIAHGGKLAYNPGELAAGETSPLYPLVLALPHALLGTTRAIVLATKALGLLLHASTATVVFVLVRRAVLGAVAPLAAFAAALLVLVQPDLLAASVSGMEVPLATTLLVGAVLAHTSERLVLAAVLAGLAYLARPETAVALIAVYGARAARTSSRALSPLAGVALAAAGFAAFCLAASGRPQPATFYAKAGVGPPLAQALEAGLFGTLGRFAGAGRVVVFVPLAGLAAWSLRRRATDAGAIALGGLVFVTTAAILTPSVDPGAFYHQRYFLPGVPLLVAGLLALLGEVLPLVTSLRAPLALGAVALGLLADDALALPRRMVRLANDARNIDDVQVLEGLALANAPPRSVVWAVDAGAIRYFGNAYVVDMIGLNTPQILDPKSDFALRHPPSHVEVVPGWSQLDGTSYAKFASQRFAPTTPYSVTGFLPMATHWLGRCPDEPWTGGYRIRGRTYRFVCAR